MTTGGGDCSCGGGWEGGGALTSWEGERGAGRSPEQALSHTAKTTAGRIHALRAIRNPRTQF